MSVPSSSGTDNVLNDIGKSPYSYALCPHASCNRLGMTFGRHPSYDWCVTLCCPCTVPHTIWYICVTCSKQRVRILTLAQLKRHRRSFHHGSKNRLDLPQQHLDDIEVDTNNGSDDNDFCTNPTFIGETEDDNNLLFDGNTEELQYTSSFGMNYLSKSSSRFFIMNILVVMVLRT